jgi:hypothetical protein
VRWFFILALVAWFLFGDPPKSVANWFWPNSAAPWETVDAFYYPDRSDLGSFQSRRGLNTVQECRDWVYSVAESRGDDYLTRGDYECGVDLLEIYRGLSVYRLTVR